MDSIGSHLRGNPQRKGRFILSFVSRKISSFLLAIGLMALGAVGCSWAADSTPNVSVETGRLAGTLEGDIASFKNIPFAAPPVGELRWAPPATPQSWTGVRDATTYGSACLQPSRRDRVTRTELTQDEDCLTLNIWAPQKAENAPVMVWIHGGAFRLGSGSLPYYDGTAFAERGVVLVTINYRLGGYGFFAHPALTKQGEATNFGLLDQIAALDWIKSNIAAFGGNPENVTIFGESAGGASVLYLLTSPLTEGLFHKAIIQSGGGGQVASCAWEACSGKPAASSDAMEWASSQGLDDPTAEELRALPADTILTFASLAKGMGYGPIIDKNVIVGNILERLEAGAAAGTPVIIGSNSNEASVMTAFGQSPERTVQMLGAQTEKLLELYGAGRDLTDEELGSEVMRDALFGAPARRVAKTLATTGAPVWRYYYDYVLERRRDTSPGANHGAEIPMVFGTLGNVPVLGRLATDADREHSEMMTKLWIAFATEGDPSLGGEINWPSADVAGDPALVIDAEGAHLEDGFQKTTLDYQDALAALLAQRR